MFILILEDDPSVCSLYTTTLEADGHRVAVYSNFEAARNACRENPPEGLLTDVRVGPYNGLQLALLFRALNETGPLVVVSGHDDPVIHEEARKIAASFFVKPVDLDVLRQNFAA